MAAHGGSLVGDFERNHDQFSGAILMVAHLVRDYPDADIDGHVGMDPGNLFILDETGTRYGQPPDQICDLIGRAPRPRSRRAFR